MNQCKENQGFSNILALCEVLEETPDYLMGIVDYRNVKKLLNEKIAERWGINTQFVKEVENGLDRKAWEEISGLLGCR